MLYWLVYRNIPVCVSVCTKYIDSRLGMFLGNPASRTGVLYSFGVRDTQFGYGDMMVW